MPDKMIGLIILGTCIVVLIGIFWIGINLLNEEKKDSEQSLHMGFNDGTYIKVRDKFGNPIFGITAWDGRGAKNWDKGILIMLSAEDGFFLDTARLDDFAGVRDTKHWTFTINELEE